MNIDKSSICVTLLTNDAYFDKMLYTLTGICGFGYTGDICIVIGDDLVNSNKLNHPLLSTTNVFIKHFTDIKFSDTFYEKFNTINRDPHWRQKQFQYHKLHLFDTFFKKWNYVLYLDSGISVYGSIQPIIDCKKQNKFLAHSDAYPTYEWTLATQFIQDDELFSVLKQKFNLDINYPQTTIMYYDTNIINENTYTDLLNLTEECKISKTNDQGIIALYFANIKNIWEQIQLGDDTYWYYDYALRPDKRNKPHLLLKVPL